MTMKKWKRNEGEKVQRSMVINCEHQNSPGNDQEIEGGIRGTDRGKGRSSQGTKGKIGNGQQNHKIDLGRRGRVQMRLEIAKNEGAQEIYRKRDIVENEGRARESRKREIVENEGRAREIDLGREEWVGSHCCFFFDLVFL